MRILSPEEIVRLTGKRTKPAQARILRHLGIDFRTRPDGEIIVIDQDLPLRVDSEQEVATAFTINGPKA